MPNSHVIVDCIDWYDQPAQRAQSLQVHFENGEVATLHETDPEYPYRLHMLTETHRAGLHLYAEVTPGDRVITNLRMPFSGRLRGLFREPGGVLTVHLDSCTKPFIIGGRHPERGNYQTLLQEAQLDDALVLITEDDDGRIADIRRMPRPPLFTPPGPPDDVPGLVRSAARPVTPERAMEMFQLVASQSCNPAAPSATCIPFLYPDNGCQVRASEMCRLIIAAGEDPLKIWNFARNHRIVLIAQTPNAPGCQVKWSFHVAVAMQVILPYRPETELFVLDPSLFPQGPVPVAQWREKQGDPHSSLSYTSHVPFLPPAPVHVQTDPEYKETDRELVRYRLLLERRAQRLPFPCPDKR